MSGRPIDLAHLAGAWVHSHEEDTPTTTVYRPAAHRFPPSRGRRRFDLRPDGTLAAARPGPADQTVSAAGTWKLAGDRLELTEPGGPTETLCVESVEPDRLVGRNTP